MNYYIFITEDDIIWGIGCSPESTVIDAHKNLKEFYAEWKYPPTKGKLIKATKELVQAVEVNGHIEDMWELHPAMQIAVLKIPKVDETCYERSTSQELEIPITTYN